MNTPNSQVTHQMVLAAQQVVPSRGDMPAIYYSETKAIIEAALTARTEAPPAAGEGFVVDTEAVRVVRLAYDAMNYLGDILNGHDMVEREDEEKTAPAFEAVRAYLAARPQPAQGDGNWQARAAFIAKSLLDTIDWPCAGERSDSGKGMAHLRYVAETIAARGLDSDTKACRWLGYLQAGLIYSAATTLDAEKERNRASEPPAPADGGKK